MSRLPGLKIVGSVVALSLSLLACNSNPRNVTSSPADSAVAKGLLEVSISGIEGGSPVAQAQWVRGSGDSSGVRAQAVTVSPELPQLSSRSVQVWDVRDDEGAITRHVSTVFEVLNSTATSFDQLWLYPLNRPGVTLGGTPLSLILTPVGSSLTDPVFARSIRPTHAMLGAGLGLAVNPEQAQLRWLSAVEVGAVKATLPPGLGDAEPLQYAFVAGNLSRTGDQRRLEPGGRGFTALSFSFPRPRERLLSPDSLVFQFAVGDDPAAVLGQSLEEQAANTVGGMAPDGHAVAAAAEVRVLSGSRYAGANRRQLCRVVTAGSLSQPLASLGEFPQGQTACAVAPVAPTRFAGTEPSYHRLSLSWDRVLEATSYTLERGLGRAPEAWTPLAPVGTSFSDTALEAGTAYTYRLRSNNAFGSSDWATLTLTTKALPFTQEAVLENIGDIPWSLNFAPDGTLIYTLRNQARLQLGRLDPATNTSAPILSEPPIEVRVGEPGQYNEGGLMGMALDPEFAANGRLYLCYGYWLDGVQRPENRFVRVSRLELVNQTLTNERVLIDRIEGTDLHSGCRVAVGGGHLFASTGEGAVSEGSQRPQRLSGKILRIALDGTIPADNPDWDNDPETRSPVWSLGHRNPQGLAFQPGSGLLWSTEHGPYTRDEINIIRPGKNYGWPHCLGTQSFGTALTAREWGGTQTFDCLEGASPSLTLENYQPALREYDPDRGVAISDLVFYPADGAAFPQWRGDILFVTLRTGRLYRVAVSGERITGDEILLEPPLLPDPLTANAAVRLRDIAVAPDGTVYLSSDNGSILRLVPRQP